MGVTTLKKNLFPLRPRDPEALITHPLGVRRVPVHGYISSSFYSRFTPSGLPEFNHINLIMLMANPTIHNQYLYELNDTTAGGFSRSLNTN